MVKYGICFEENKTLGKRRSITNYFFEMYDFLVTDWIRLDMRSKTSAARCQHFNRSWMDDFALNGWLYRQGCLLERRPFRGKMSIERKVVQLGCLFNFAVDKLPVCMWLRTSFEKLSFEFKDFYFLKWCPNRHLLCHLKRSLFSRDSWRRKVVRNAVSLFQNCIFSPKWITMIFTIIFLNTKAIKLIFCPFILTIEMRNSSVESTVWRWLEAALHRNHYWIYVRLKFAQLSLYKTAYLFDFLHQ